MTIDTSTATIAVALVGIIGSVFSLIVTVVIAAWNVKSAQAQASDEISTGASLLLKEYRSIRESDKLTIEKLEMRIMDLETWKRNVNIFIMPLLDGAHQLANQVVSLKSQPVYNPPAIPDWLQQKEQGTG